MDQTAHSPTLILSIAAMVVLFARTISMYVSYKRRERRLVLSYQCKPITSLAPVKDPILGLDFLWESLCRPSSHEYVRVGLDFFRSHGTTYGVHRWTWRTINTCDRRNIQHILATAFDDFEIPRLRVDAVGGLFGRGIFVARRHCWAPARAVLRPSFTKRNTAPLPEIAERHFRIFADRIARHAGGTVDLQPLFFALTMDTVTELFVGISTDMLRSSDGEAGSVERFVDDYFTCCVEAVKRLQLGPLGRLRYSRAAHRARHRILAYVDEFVDRALASPAAGKAGPSGGSHGERYDLLREMLGRSRDREALSHQILHVLLAGRDTTASLLSNLFFVLARDKRAWDRLRREVDQKVAGELPTEAELREMTYLKWCLNESLRLHPVVPINAREATADTILPKGGGTDGESPIFVRKGTPVLYSVFSMHRDPAIYGDRVDDFVPERWDGLRPGWGYLPFNGGPRVCVGQQFALLEASYVTVRMLQTFGELEPRDGRPWAELYTLTMCSRNGVQVAVKPR